MTFAHVWPLFLVVIPAVWVIYAWRSAANRFRLCLKVLSFGIVLLAIAEPRLNMPETKTAAVILVDTSSSITRADLARASSVVRDIARHRRGNWMEVVPFARQTRVLPASELAHGAMLARVSGELVNGTNFEAALSDAMAAFPSGHVPRIVLISDGNNNEGSTPRAIAELARLRVPVDTIPLSGRRKTGLQLVSTSMPREAYAGEQIPIDLTIISPQAIHAIVTISADGRPLGSNPIELSSGTNSVRVHARVKSSGAIAISGNISGPPLGDVIFEQALTLKRPRVLYLSQDPPSSETNFLQALAEAGFEVTRDASLIARGLTSIQLVVLNNLDLNALSTVQKSRLEQYAKNGGGLLLIGGEKQTYKDESKMDVLDRALPAKLAPPKTEQGTCVALVIDKSSSMEGRKIELARLSAIGVVDRLKPTDIIGVLIFDNSYQWAVPMRRVQDKSIIKRLISGIMPDGGTQIAPALAEAYRRVMPARAVYKHIVLLTDGISEEGDSMDLAREAAQHQITISTVGLGQDVNRSYLEKIAATSGGRSYFLNEPQGLEQILLKDVQDYSGSTAIEKPLIPIVNRRAEILEGVGMEAAPPLKGYARFMTKPAAETILSIDQEKRDPLYVRWQYGLGRAGVFTSDAKSRWAASWVTWPGFDKFWINVCRDLLAHTNQTEATSEFETASGDISVTYHVGPGVTEPAAAPEIFALGPNGFEKPVLLRRTAPRVYRGRVHIGGLTGLFRIRPLSDSPQFPETGLYRDEEELKDYGSNEPLLREISSLTGGRFNPPLDAVFDSGGKSVYTTWQLWPALLGLAIALTIAELIARKWRGIMQHFRAV